MPLYQHRANNVEKTFLFIHIPKTGGTALEAYFRNIGLVGYFDPPTYMPVRPYLTVPPVHFDYEYTSKMFILDKLYSFAVVRHPVKRMISEFKWARENSTLPDALKNMNFSDFIRFMFAEYRLNENLMSGHFKPQVRFVGEKVSKVFKYEAGLDNVMRHVLQDVGLMVSAEVKIPVVNKASDQKIVLSESDLELIHEVYAEDFAAFGYSPQPTVDRTGA